MFKSFLSWSPRKKSLNRSRIKINRIKRPIRERMRISKRIRDLKRKLNQKNFNILNFIFFPLFHTFFDWFPILAFIFFGLKNWIASQTRCHFENP